MHIDFQRIPEQALEHFKGGESVFYAHIDDQPAARLIKGRLIPGASIGWHCHENDSETIFIVSGSGKALFEKTTEMLRAGDCHYCPKGCSHSLINDGETDLCFFAVVAK